MKKLLFLIYASLILNNSSGQTNFINVCQDCFNIWHGFDFNSQWDSSFFYFYFDTTQSNNIWQVGTPGKTIFNSGYFNPKALVTDTVNPYPVNNISSFQFSVINCSWDNVGNNCGGNYWGPYFSIFHRIESDSGLDGGTIEVSHDNGVTWLNLIQDTINSPYITSGNIYTINDTVASLGKPGFSGSAGWNNIQFNYQPSMIASTFDTITLRFVFASDSIQTNKDGWMIGLVTLEGAFEGIQEIQNNNLISISPNPVSDELKVHLIKPDPTSRIQIVNYTGQVFYDKSDFKTQTINTHYLSNGIYLLKYFDSKYSTAKKIIVHHN